MDYGTACEFSLKADSIYGFHVSSLEAFNSALFSDLQAAQRSAPFVSHSASRTGRFLSSDSSVRRLTRSAIELTG